MKKSERDLRESINRDLITRAEQLESEGLALAHNGSTYAKMTRCELARAASELRAAGFRIVKP